MIKRFPKLFIASAIFMFIFTLSMLSTYSVKAASISIFEVGEVRSLGDEVKVPVFIRDTTYLTSIQAKISFPSTSSGITLQEFEPVPLFNGKLFRMISNINGNTLTIDFQSQTGEEQKLQEDNILVGYVRYKLSGNFTPGQMVPLEIMSVVAKGRNGSDLALKALNGTIERKMPFGDVVGHNEANAAGAMRILQHIKGNYITDREQFLSADVDGDGKLTQNDAMQILDYISGQRTTFIAVEAKELSAGVLNSPYTEKVEALHGRAPYEFKRGSGFPSGITLNETTGEITGVPKKPGSYTFTIEVTDAVGNEAEREFKMTVVDSDIASVEKIETINVKRGAVPNLPAHMKVTYKDKTTGLEKVTWEPVDTTVLGTVTAKGKIGSSGYIVTAVINVVNQNYIGNISVGYLELLDFHTITVNVSEDVYDVKINNLPAHYEGDNQFSLASTTFTRNSSVTLRLYDKYGNLLETKIHKLTVN